MTGIKGGGPRGGENQGDIWDVRFARRVAREAIRRGRPVSALVAWIMSPEWTLVAIRGHGFRGCVNHTQMCNEAAGEIRPARLAQRQRQGT